MKESQKAAETSVFITVAGAARVLGITEQAVLRLIARGRLHGVKGGKRIFISYADVTTRVGGKSNAGA